MKTSGIVSQLGISDATVRRWTREFEDFMSDDANRKHSLQSSFTKEDLAVFATVKKLSGEGYSLKVISQRLKEGYRVDVDNLADIGYADGRMVPAAVVEQVVDAAEIRAELEYSRSQVSHLLQMAKNQSDLIDSLRDEIKDLNLNIRDLERKLGRAEGKLEHLDPRQD